LPIFLLDKLKDRDYIIVKPITGRKAMYDDYYDDPRDYADDYRDFADPGGRSALRAASRSNPRNLPCPTCGFPNRLTPKDRACGYQCDTCANRAEQGLDPIYYEDPEKPCGCGEDEVCAECECEYCGEPWTPDHECYGTRGEAAHARRMEEDH
jgi:hypothetical protein